MPPILYNQDDEAIDVPKSEVENYLEHGYRKTLSGEPEAPVPSGANDDRTPEEIKAEAERELREGRIETLVTDYNIGEEVAEIVLDLITEDEELSTEDAIEVATLMAEGNSKEEALSLIQDDDE